jgi:uncharacterized protein
VIVVADTSPLLHLARIGRVDLVAAVVGNVVLPRTVWDELTASGGSSQTSTMTRLAWLQVLDDPPLQDIGLDAGETAAILLAQQLNADALLIDERLGRREATRRGLRVIGTLGILVGARRIGAIAEVAPLITQLRAGGFWLSDDLVASMLRSVGED